MKGLKGRRPRCGERSEGLGKDRRERKKKDRKRRGGRDWDGGRSISLSPPKRNLHSAGFPLSAAASD